MDKITPIRIDFERGGITYHRGTSSSQRLYYFLINEVLQNFDLPLCDLIYLIWIFLNWSSANFRSFNIQCPNSR